jgi:hypothetical protein
MSGPLLTWEDMEGFDEQAMPVSRSFEETAVLAFRAQDQADATERRRTEQANAERRATAEDASTVASFLGRTRTHADVLAGMVASAERVDAWEKVQREKAERRRDRDRDERIFQLEEELAAAEAERARSLRTLAQANDVAAAFHRRAAKAEAEGASFRDAAYRSYYR